MSEQSTFPQPGENVWTAWARGRHGKPGGAILWSARDRVGGKHLVFGKSAAFAGRRWNEDLDRSDTHAEVSSSVGGRTGDSGCSSERRGGERRQLAANKARAPDARVLKKDTSRLGDTSFTRSEGLCTSILTTHPRGNSRMVRRIGNASRSGKPGQPGGTGTEVEPNGRSAARRASPLPQGRGRGASKKRKVIAVTVPARKRESMVAVPARRCSLQKSVGERLASNTLAPGLQKERRREWTVA